MDVLREREVKDSLERQLQDEQKVRGEYDMRSSVRSSSREARLEHPRDFSKIYLDRQARLSSGSPSDLGLFSSTDREALGDTAKIPSDSRVSCYSTLQGSLSLTRVVDSLQSS